MTQAIESSLKRFGAEVAETVVNLCAEKYGFSSEEALSLLGEPSVNRQSKEPRARGVLVKPRFPLPYNGEYDVNKCHALRQNQGLYTQCQLVQTSNSYCNQCYKLSKKTETGIPEYGTIEQRKSAYDSGETFTDPTGRTQTPYYKIMNKYQVSKEDVEEEAAKFGIIVNPIHYEVLAPKGGRRPRPSQEKEAKEPKGSKGRPKKEKKVIQIEGDDDLFAALVASANGEEEMQISSKNAEEKAAKEAKRLQEKAERELKLAAEKAEKEAKKAAEKEAREIKLAQEKYDKEAREMKRLHEKAQREEKLAQEKYEKEAREHKRLQEKAEREAKLAAEKAEKEAKKKAEKEAKKPSSQETDDEPEIVKKITFNDKKYLLSKKTGIVYDYDIYVNEQEQVVIGKWNEAEQKIVFTSAEETEDEYESEDEEEYEVNTVGGGVSMGP